MVLPQLVAPGPVVVTMVAGAVMTGGVVSHIVTGLEAKVTSPLFDRTRPSIVVPAPTVTAPAARMLPLKVALAPSVTAPPTPQNTLQARAPPVRLMTVAAVVLRAAGVLMMKIELAPPLRVSAPIDIAAVDSSKHSVT